MQMEIGHDAPDSPEVMIRIFQRHPAHDAVDSVTLFQKKLRQI
jgi:hypothetical protein